MDLLWLAPDIQEAVLDGAPVAPMDEAGLRRIATASLWSEQRRDLPRRPRA